MKIPINNIINFVLSQTIKHNVDESHSLNHALDVLDYSNKILKEETYSKPYLNKQEHIIYTSALLHDTCDSKYSDNVEIEKVCSFLKDNQYSTSDINVIMEIISTMSYSKVKKNGFPELDTYQDAYHVVREADLLAGYKLNRAILYGIHRENLNYIDSFYRSKDLYSHRMGNFISDGLFLTKYGISESISIDNEERRHMENLEEIVKNSF